MIDAKIRVFQRYLRIAAEDLGRSRREAEGKSSGTQLIQDLQNDGVWKVVEYKPPPGADKVMRLHACSDRFESGRVVLPRNAPWLDEYILELIGFPGTKHDDRSTRPPRRSTTSASQGVWLT